ncbi:hypothetical protein HDV00_005247 [Rhizophlyctis rosea]|nr:hypothetical protein HDV00_005247 [Rhizophlyctis rosea]
MSPDPSIDDLASVVVTCLHHNVVPPHVHAHFQAAAEVILAAAIDHFGPQTELVLGGSLSKGTDLIGSDGDFIVGTAEKVTLGTRKTFATRLENVFGEKALITKNAISFDGITLPNHDTAIDFDITFTNTTFGHGGVDPTTLPLEPPVQSVSRLFKLFRRHNTCLPAMPGLHYEWIVLYVWRNSGNLRSRCNENPHRGMLLLFIHCLKVLGEFENVQELADALRGMGDVARMVPMALNRQGALMSWRERGAGLVRRLRTCVVRDVEDFLAVLQERELTKRRDFFDFEALMRSPSKVLRDFGFILEPF